MVKYTYVERIVKKVRKLLKYNSNAMKCMTGVPNITLDNNYCVSVIYWNFYDWQLIISDKWITFKDDTGTHTLLGYDNFDELLSM